MRHSLTLGWRILRTEGPLALRDRLLDRLEERRRLLNFPSHRLLLEEPPAGADAPSVPPSLRSPLLNLTAQPPAPRFGGVAVQLLTRLEAEAFRRPCALLFPSPGGFRLELRNGPRRMAFLLAGVGLAADPETRNSSFERGVQLAARLVGARHVHVESAAGFPLESLLSLEASGLGLVLSVHDFSLFCRRPHLLEMPQGKFCAYCREPVRCHRCLSQSWAVDEGFQNRWRGRAAELLRRVAVVIFPSDFLRERHLDLFPRTDSIPWVVLPPPAPPARPGPPLPRVGRGLHVAFLGGGHAHKGARVFEDVVCDLSRDPAGPFRWTVYGGGGFEGLERLRRLPRTRVRGYFRAGRLPGLLVRDRVDVALLLSTVPESYSLTLSECRLAGVPVIALARGALIDRVSPWDGMLVAPEKGAAGVARALRELAKRQPEGGPRMPERVFTSPSPPSPDGAASAMIRLYRAADLLTALEEL